MKEITEKELSDFALNLECEIIPRLKSAGFERNKYNVFNILRLNRYELRHSDFLAFLMTPDQSGNIGEQFLRHFLIMLAERCGQKLENPTKIINYEFKKVIVRREHKCIDSRESIDLLVDIEIKSKCGKILIVIENKVDSYERTGDGVKKGQLRAYKDAIEIEYKDKDYKPIYLFLTPDKRKAKEDNEWISIGYDFVDEVIYRLDLDTVDNTVRSLISDYRKLIRSEFDMGISEQEQQAVNDLYSKYKDVFEYININKPNRVNTTAKIIRERLKIEEEIVFNGSDNQNTYIIFTTKEIHDFDEKTKALELNVYFQINVKEMKVEFRIEGGVEHRENLKIDTKKTQESQYLLDKNNKKNAENIEKHESFLLNKNESELTKEIETMLQNLFATDGFIYKNSDDICEKLRKLKEENNSDS